MKTTVFLLVVLFVYNAFACPDLSGMWECRESTSAPHIKLNIQLDGDGKKDLYKYTFTQSDETTQYFSPVTNYPDYSEPGFLYTSSCTEDALNIEANERKMPDGRPSKVFINHKLQFVSGSQNLQFVWNVKSNIWGNIDAEVVCNRL